jgi:anthranilate phosphoribosyltransferase
VVTGTVDPTAYGLDLAPVEALRGGDVAQNADVVQRLLAGETGPVRDAVLLNAGAALVVYDAPADPPEKALAAGIARARAAIDTGAARATLERWVAASGA